MEADKDNAEVTPTQRTKRAASFTSAHKNRFDALMKLAEFRTAQRDNRRIYEFRVSGVLWLGLAAATVQFRAIPHCILLTALPVIILSHAFFWVRWASSKNRNDLLLAKYYTEIAENLVLPDTNKAKREQLSRWGILFDFLIQAPALFQVLVTIFLTIALAYYGSMPATRECPPKTIVQVKMPSDAFPRTPPENLSSPRPQRSTPSGPS